MSLNKNSSIYIQNMNDKINTSKDEIESLKNGIISLQNNAINYEQFNNQNYYNKQHMSNEYLETLESSKNFEQNYENDSVKLNNEIIKLKNQNRRLKDTIKIQENGLKDLTDKIIQLHKLLNFKNNEMNNVLTNQENKINEILNEKDKLLDESRYETLNEIERIKKEYEEQLNKKDNEIQILNEKCENQQKIISNFFTFYNYNIDIINQIQILDYKAEKIELNLKDHEENLKNSLLEIDILNKFFLKIMQDNKEMYELLIYYKDIIKENEIIQNNQKNELLKLEEAEFDNKYLKGQVNNLLKELSKTNYQNINNYEIYNDEIEENIELSLNIDDPFRKIRNKIENLEKRLVKK